MPEPGTKASSVYTTAEIDEMFAARDVRLDDLDGRVAALEGGTPPDPPDPPDPPLPAAGVDLTVVEFNPPALVQGQPATLECVVRNEGDEAVTTGVIIGVGFLLDDAQVGAQVAWASFDSGLPPDHEVRMSTASSPMHSAPWSPGVAGAHTLTAYVDDTARIPEAHEDNNRRTVNVTIAPAPPRPAGQTLFVASSSWNTRKVPAAFVDGCDGTLRSCTYRMNASAYGHPMTWAKNSDPMHTFHMPNTWGWPAQTVQAHMRDDATPASGTDGHLCLLNVDTGDLLDMWQLRGGNREWSCSAWARHSWTTGSGWGTASPFLSAGVTVSGAPTGAGTITHDEVAAVKIPHACCLAYGYGDMHAPQVPPAIANDTGGGGGPLQQGMLLVAQGNEPGGLRPIELELWRACRDYGAFIVDKADPDHVGYFYCAEERDGGAFTESGLTAIGRSLRAVKTW